MAQPKGKFRVYTDPDSAIIKFNNKTLEYGTFYEMDTGHYVVKAWAKHRELVEKKMYIKESAIVTLPIKLPYAKDYRKYKYHTKVYHVKKATLRYSVLLSYFIYSAMAIPDIKRFNEDADRFEEEANFYKNEYERSFWVDDLNFNKARFEQSRNNYNDAIENVNSRYLTLQIGAGVTAIATYYGWRLAKKVKKPTYEEKPLLSNLTITPQLINRVGLTINTKF